MTIPNTLSRTSLFPAGMMHCGNLPRDSTAVPSGVSSMSVRNIASLRRPAQPFLPNEGGILSSEYPSGGNGVHRNTVSTRNSSAISYQAAPNPNSRLDGEFLFLGGVLWRLPFIRQGLRA